MLNAIRNLYANIKSFVLVKGGEKTGLIVAWVCEQGETLSPLLFSYAYELEKYLKDNGNST